jgi:signal transduction histidine kinase
MSARTARLIAVTSTLATAAVLAAGWAYSALNHDLNPFTSGFGPDLVIPLGILPVGFIIALRQRTNPIGWLFIASAFFSSLAGAAGEYALHWLIADPHLPGGLWAAWLSNWVLSLVFPAGTFLFVLLRFPNGRLVSPRWRILVRVAIVAVALSVLSSLFADWPISVANGVRSVPNPTGIHGFASSALGFLWVMWPITNLLLLFGAASIVIRFRRAPMEEREQIKWFAYAVATTFVAYAISIPFSLSAQYSPWSNVVLEVGIGIALPAACGIAILRYRLYDIDVVISKTLVYGTLAALITGVYVGIAVGIGTLVGGGGKPNLALSIIATAIVAVGFQPVRARLQRVVNRLVYGARATPYEVLSEFAGRVAETYAADDVLPRMVRVLQEGTGAATATVWLRSGDQLRPAASYPDEIAALHPIAVSGTQLPAFPEGQSAVAVRHHEELLGALTINKRRGETLTPIEHKLLDDLGQQAGLVLKNVGLTDELRQRLDDLRASRMRLVEAQDAERRRIERNLHDGAQQHLVALKVKLGLAEMLLQKDMDKARATLQQLKADADEALETLRDLARGIYPPILADKGLVIALQGQARKATLPVVVEAETVRRYPQAQEAAAYFCVLEALQNVQKYAAATCVTVRVDEGNGVLHFEVEDDGRGFDAATAQKGSGLTNMADRLDALGGRMEVDAHAGAGCRIRGWLPVEPLTETPESPVPGEMAPAVMTVGV